MDPGDFITWTTRSRRGHLKTQKALKTLGGWGTPLGELTPLPRPGNSPPPKPHYRSQHFGLPTSDLKAEATEPPQFTVEPGPLRALLHHSGPGLPPNRSYYTTRDVILTCARKPTRVSLIYRTETTTRPKKCKTEKLKGKNGYTQK